MKKIITLIFLGITLMGVSQVDYLDYHRGVSDATVCALDSNYSLSLKKFDSIFSKYEFNFPNDLYIASQVAILVDSVEKAKEYLKRTFYFNPQFNFYKKNKIFRSKIKDWKKLKKEYEKLRELGKKNINWKLRKEIDSMNTIDQRERDKAHMILNKRKRELALKKWIDNTTAPLVDKIKEIVLEYGFPSYRIIGCDKKATLNSNNALYILYHWYNSFSFIGQEVLLNEVKKGNLHLKQFMLLSDYEVKFSNEFNLNKDKQYPYYVIWPYNHSSDNKIESNRKEIGYFDLSYSKKMLKAQSIYFKNFRKKNSLNIDYLFWHL